MMGQNMSKSYDSRCVLVILQDYLAIQDLKYVCAYNKTLFWKKG